MNDVMTEEEHHAMDLTAQLWNYLSQNVIGHGEGRAKDSSEIVHHIHGLQRAIMANAAARAYPDRYRLLGGDRVREVKDDG